MNQIKFRAWHKKYKKHYRVLHLHIATIFQKEWATCAGRDCIEQKEIHIDIQPNDCIIEQYIGLTDINDKEIFEGDIVRFGAMDDIIDLDDDGEELEIKHFDTDAQISVVGPKGTISGDFEDCGITLVEWAMEREFYFEVVGHKHSDMGLLK